MYVGSINIIKYLAQIKKAGLVLEIGFVLTGWNSFISFVKRKQILTAPWTEKASDFFATLQVAQTSAPNMKVSPVVCNGQAPNLVSQGLQP